MPFLKLIFSIIILCSQIIAVEWIQNKDDFISPEKLIIQKGSITINGTSLTVTGVNNRQFGVAIIPYTYEHTNFHTLKVGEKVNIELDVLGKYVARLTD